MPEYLAPGVYVEEVSFRSKSIEGVSTSTAGFVGPTRFGPITGEPELITSFNQFERIYGGLDRLGYVGEGDFGVAPTQLHNYLAHAVRAFFENGGRRLYVGRAFRSFSAVNQALTGDGGTAVAVPPGLSADGVATALMPRPAPQIAAADAAAAGAVLEGRAAILAAALAVTEAHGAALAALDAALTHIGAALPLGTALPDIDTETLDAAAILTAVDGVVDTLPDPSPERAAAAAAVGEATAAINSGVAARDAAAAAEAGVEAAPAQGFATAITVGFQEGQGAPLPDGADPAAVAELAAGNAGAAATAAADAAEAAATQTDTLHAARETLGLAAAALAAATTNRPALAGAAIAAADAALTLTTGAGGTIESADAAVAAATAAARAGAVAARAATAAAIGTLSARFPGAAGNMRVTINTRLGQNVLSANANGENLVSQVKAHDLVLVSRGTGHTLFIATNQDGAWQFANPDAVVNLSDLNPAADPPDQVRIVTFSVTLLQPGAFAQPQLWSDLTVHPQRLQDGITHVFAEEIGNRARYLETPLIVDDDGDEPVQLARSLIGNAGLSALPDSGSDGVVNEFTLQGGNDGVRPSPAEYRGQGSDDDMLKSGLLAFEEIEEISIIAAPGASARGGTTFADSYQTISQALIAHCEKMRYRVAALDSPDDQALSQVRRTRALLDTTRAAFYYPWVRVMDPITRQPIHVPPSGFVTGIYARNDVEIGVHKAPANEVLLGAIGLETVLNKAQQDVLNPLGINCIRYFEGRGIRLWGARTVSSDPEWKYLNIRRYFAFLEQSIERSTQWAVFEPNGDTLWANVRRSVEDFLYSEWKSDHLAGVKPSEAFFVRCDRSTMTQNDLDNGRMICLIGVAPLYPAEFVIFRIGQWTADRAA